MNRTVMSVAALAAVILSVPGTALATTEPGPTEDGPAFCTDYLDVLGQFMSDAGPDPDLASAGLAAMTESAPADIADSVTIVVDGASAELGGEAGATETPEFGEAFGVLDSWTFDNCPFDSKVEVAAVDWAFGGIPLELPAGSAAFRVTNIGAEMHEMSIVRKLDGVTESWDEIMPILVESFFNEDEAAMEYVEYVGHAWIPTAEASAVAYADLVPGEYAAFCMLPIGTNHEMSEEDMEELAGPGYEAHWQHGMLQEFTVVEAG